MLIVQVRYLSNGSPYYLVGTTWTNVRGRATTFATEADARAAFAKAMKFTKPRLFAQAYGKPEIISV